jgi:arsenite methyltransferase
MKEHTQQQSETGNSLASIVEGARSCCGYQKPQNKTTKKPDEADTIRKAVRKGYGDIAKANAAGCGCSGSSVLNALSTIDHSVALGYSQNDVHAAPAGANMGLGCGNPQAIANLVTGETVLDLGSGGGFDSFLAAHAVGEKGYVIGVDMTPEMITKAKENALKAGIKNCDFRLGEIESLPVEDNTVDVIISNCVINLSPEKERVFREAFRVLKPGGRLAVSDVVSTTHLPEKLKNDLALHIGCIAGASVVDELESMIKAAGFTNVSIKPKDESRTFIHNWAPGKNIEDYILSAVIEATKPR